MFRSFSLFFGLVAIGFLLAHGFMRAGAPAVGVRAPRESDSLNDAVSLDDLIAVREIRLSSSKHRAFLLVRRDSRGNVSRVLVRVPASACRFMGVQLPQDFMWP
jgi:hypothetical protein